MSTVAETVSNSVCGPTSVPRARGSSARGSSDPLYVQGSDYAYAEEQMAIWRKWAAARRAKRLGITRSTQNKKSDAPRVTIPCAGCGWPVSIRASQHESNQRLGRESLCRECCTKKAATTYKEKTYGKQS
jgi:hypothetical protein